ncbi:uncharacterized protein LOC135810651 [Sycon ciliatum]|uniref:uncharacterized protein LOC135810651 n=1 Tax=Sycon ciliatum TaxID=27933 RepID=UPI0031F6B48B
MPPPTTVATTAAPPTTVATTTPPTATVATTRPPTTTGATTAAPAITVAATTSPVTNLNFECRGFNIMISLNRTTLTEANTLCTQQSGMKLLRSRWQRKLEECYMPILNRVNVEEIWMRQIRKNPKVTAWMMYNVSSSQLNPTPDASATAAFICAGKYLILHDDGLPSLLC